MLVKPVETPRKFMQFMNFLIATINLRGVSTSLTSILYAPCNRTRNLLKHHLSNILVFLIVLKNEKFTHPEMWGKNMRVFYSNWHEY